ncbi:hypothetical protein ACFXPW_10525 [Streptomyces goshikiensis]|uniref:hypothetical protein n=1 Tax=Streptomyces goshikiensis TaxID=1942 RepID=UPI0036814D3C
MDMVGAGLARGVCGVLALVVVAGGLTGCSALSPFTTCEGTEAAMTSLRRDPVLEVRPEGTRELKGFEGLSSACVDDSGDAWMTASRLYAAPADAATVLRFYGEAATADGWRQGKGRADPPVLPVLPVLPEVPGPPGEMARSCFSRGGEGRVRELTVDIVPARRAKEEYGWEPPAPPAVETLYTVDVGAAVDGTRMEC